MLQPPCALMCCSPAELLRIPKPSGRRPVGGTEAQGYGDIDVRGHGRRWHQASVVTCLFLEQSGLGPVQPLVISSYRRGPAVSTTGDAVSEGTLFQLILGFRLWQRSPHDFAVTDSGVIPPLSQR